MAEPGPHRFLATASAIADDLHRAALSAKDGSAVWRAPGGEPGKPAVLPPHVYGGTAGVAMFLAACDRLQERDDHHELVLRAIAPLRRLLAGLAADPERAAARRLDVGGLIGLGSFLYSFLQLAHWLDEPDLVREAHDVSALLTPERIAQDEFLDVVLGSAGAVLALLALHRVRPEPNRAGFTPLAAAAACARHLLASRVSLEGRPRAWPPLPGRLPSTGFSHGAAGIAYALLRLHAVTGDPVLREAAEEGLAFERGLFSPEHRNWRDMRVNHPRYLTMWCHGAPGIALGRLAVLDLLDGPEIRQEIADALATTRAVPLTDVDHLCCGNFGRADILLDAARRLGDDSLREAALDLARRALDRAEENGRFGLPSPAETDPTLFKGTAGIGYALLRLAHPESLPCWLALEPAGAAGATGC